MDKINNISSAALENGISEDSFVKLLNDIKNVVNESTISLNKYDELVVELRNTIPASAIEEWIEKFKTQIAKSSANINENLKNIEELFKRIFNDWNEYQKNNEIDNKGDTNE